MIFFHLEEHPLENPLSFTADGQLIMSCSHTVYSRWHHEAPQNFREEQCLTGQKKNNK